MDHRIRTGRNVYTLGKNFLIVQPSLVEIINNKVKTVRQCGFHERKNSVCKDNFSAMQHIEQLSKRTETLVDLKQAPAQQQLKTSILESVRSILESVNKNKSTGHERLKLIRTLIGTVAKPRSTIRAMILLDK